ncbi:hypothetical protein CDD83_6546 [Cordyceps sp. RAO-2017]|nr:hypothetical protein CDD83_6546 [Cordyceps sp. RAO-2017]
MTTLSTLTSSYERPSLAPGPSPPPPSRGSVTRLIWIRLFSSTVSSSMKLLVTQRRSGIRPSSQPEPGMKTPASWKSGSLALSSIRTVGSVPKMEATSPCSALNSAGNVALMLGSRPEAAVGIGRLRLMAPPRLQLVLGTTAEGLTNFWAFSPLSAAEK